MLLIGVSEHGLYLIKVITVYLITAIYTPTMLKI